MAKRDGHVGSLPGKNHSIRFTFGIDVSDLKCNICINEITKLRVLSREISYQNIRNKNNCIFIHATPVENLQTQNGID